MIEKVVRKDKLKNKSKVIKSLIKDPLQTERQVAKDTWLSNWTAHNQIRELKQNWAESQIMDRVLEMDDEIMDLVKDGYSNLEIADTLHISLNSVKTHLRNITTRLGAKNRAHAVALHYIFHLEG